MKKIILFFTVIIICLNTNAQDKKSSSSAVIKGTITDFEMNIKVGETILFENSTTNKIYKSMSNDSGKFQIQLPYGCTYLIKIKGFSDDLEYSEFSIPELKKNESSLTFQIDIQFEPGKKFILKNVYFNFGKASLTKESFKELDNLVSFMKTRKNEIIEIGGHTDNVGSIEENKVLSRKRANAIASYLVKNGIDSDRVTAVGYGEEFPSASNETEEGRKLNRRTEVKIITSPNTK